MDMSDRGFGDFEECLTQVNKSKGNIREAEIELSRQILESAMFK